MAERQNINEVVQLGVESAAAPGVAVVATKRMQALRLNLSPQLETSHRVPMGFRWPTVNVLNKEWTDLGVDDFAAVFTEVVYPISGLLGAATITTPGGGTLSRDWDWNPSTSNALTPVTFTVEQGGPVRAARAAGCQFTDLTMDASRDEIKMGGAGIGGQYVDPVAMSTNATYLLTAAASPPTSGTFTLTKSAQTTTGIAFGATPATVQAALEALSTIGAGNVTVTLQTLGPTLATANSVYRVEFVGTLGGAAQTLTGTFTSLVPSASVSVPAGVVGSTPTSVALVPIQPTQVSVYLDPSAATLGNSKLLRVYSVGFNLSSLYGPMWVLDAAKPSYAATVETMPGGEVSLVMQADATGLGSLADVRVGTRRFIRIEAIGPLIEGAIFYRFRFDAAVEVSSAPKFGDEQATRSVGWTFSIMHDSVWSKALSINVRNTLTAL